MGNIGGMVALGKEDKAKKKIREKKAKFQQVFIFSRFGVKKTTLKLTLRTRK